MKSIIASFKQVEKEEQHQQLSLVKYKANFYNSLHEELLVDFYCKDKWRVGRIISIQPESRKAEVQHDGTNKITDIPLKPNALQPYRTMTFLSSELIDSHERLVDLRVIESDLVFWSQFFLRQEEFTCEEINQKIRGEFLILIDFVTHFNNILTSATYMKLLEAVRAFWVFLEGYLSDLKKNLVFFQMSNKELFLTCPQLASVAAFPELVEILSLSLLISQKKVKIDYFIEETIFESLEGRESTQNYKTYLQMNFQDTQILNLMNEIIQHSAEYQSSQKTIQLKTPPRFVKIIYNFMVRNSLQLPNKDLFEKHFQKTNQVTDDYLENLSVEDSQWMELEYIHQLIINKQEDKSSYDKSNFDIISFETMKINILILFLKNSKYSQKFQCVSFLNAYKAKKYPKQLQDYVIKTFYKKDIVELLYGNNSSNEIIENTMQFTDFLSQKQSFDYVQQILRFQNSADYARTQVLLKVLEFFVNKMDSGSLQSLIEKLQKQGSFCLEELKFLLSCISKQNEGGLMSTMKTSNIKDSTKNDVLFLLFELIKEYKGQDEEEVRSLCLSGFKSILENHKAKNVLQQIFDSIFKEIRRPQVVQIDLLRLIVILAERIITNQGFLKVSFFSALNQNFDKNYFKNENILKILFSFLELSAFKNHSKEYKSLFFTLIKLIISKIGDLLLEKQYFTKIWLRILEMKDQDVQEMMIDVIKTNYDKKFENFQIFPLYFQSEIITEDLITVPFLRFFQYLFIVENEKKGNLEIISNNPDDSLFVFKQSFESCVGLTHFWKFYRIFSDKAQIQLLTEMMINIHRAMSLNDSVDFAKKIAHFFIKNFKTCIEEAVADKNETAIRDYFDLAHLHVQSLSEVSLPPIIKNPVALTLEFNQSSQSVVLESSMTLMQLRNFINNRYLLKDQFDLEIKGKKISSIQLLNNYDLQSIEANKLNQKLVRVVPSESPFELEQVKKFFIQVLRLDEQFFKITEEIFEQDNPKYRETFVDFLIKIQPQNSYLNYLSAQLEKKPTVSLSLIMHESNPAKLYYFSSLLKFIIVKEFETKVFQISSLLIKRHLANFIGLLQKSLDKEVQAMNHSLFVNNLIIIFSKLIQDKIDMKDFQLNIKQINSKIIKESTLWSEKNNENLQDFISLQINLLKSQGITTQQYLAVLKQLNLQNQQKYDILQFLSYSIDFVEVASENIDSLITQFQKVKSEIFLPLKLVFLKAFIKSKEYQKTLEIINYLVAQIYQKSQSKEENFLFLINFSLEVITGLLTEPLFDPKPVVDWIAIHYFENSHFYIQELATKPQIKANISFIVGTIYQNDQHSHLIEKLIQELLMNVEPRDDSLESWNILHQKEKVNRGQFPGLVNYGCTCYINSLIQLLFMIQPFNEYISKIEPEEEHTKLIQFKGLLNQWKFSQTPFLEPKKLIKELKTFEGLDINFSQQMDVDEFFITFIDQIERELKAQNIDYLERFFYGSLSQEIIPSNCSHKSLKKDQFSSINLFIKDIDNIYKSLDTYVEWDKLEGINEFFCHECDAKKPAKKRISFDVLPNYQVFILKRFEYNYVTGTKVKLGNKVEFPNDLSLEKYYFQSDKEELKEKEYFDYKLKGIIVHIGHAEGGHYFSYIQNESGTWFEFNDQEVKIVDFAEVQNTSFGKQLKQQISVGAYVLLYERTKKFNSKKEILSDIFEGIILKGEETESINIIRRKEQLSFNAEFLQNQECLSMVSLSDVSDPREGKFELLVNYFFIILLRRKSKATIPKFYAIIEHLLQDKKYASLFIKLFSNKNVLDEFLIRCPVSDMSFLTLSLLYVSIQTLQSKNSRDLNRFLRVVCSMQNVFVSGTQNSKFIAILLCNITLYKKNCIVLKNLGFSEFGDACASVEFYSKQPSFECKELSEDHSSLERKTVPSDLTPAKTDHSLYMIRIFINYLLSLGSYYYKKYPLFKEVQFWITMVNQPLDKKTQKRLSEFFVIIHRQDTSFIYSLLNKLPITLYNYSSVFYFYSEILGLEDEVLSDKILQSLTQTCNAELFSNYFFFDDLYCFIIEQYFMKKQFKSLILQKGQSLLQKLKVMNSSTLSLASMKRQNISIRIPKNSPIYQYSQVIWDEEQFDGFLQQHSNKRESVLKAMKEEKIEALKSGLKYFRFFTHDIEKQNVGSKLIVRVGLLEFENAEIVRKLGQMIELRFLNPDSKARKWFTVDEEILFEILF